MSFIRHGRGLGEMIYASSFHVSDGKQMFAT